jgi:hypothetical protein
MSCPCSKLPSLVKVDADQKLMMRLAELATGNWVRLCRCRRCGQLWRVDEWDKYQIQFAVKIADSSGWQEFDSEPLRKQFLVESRGGVTEESCNWAGCEKHRLKGVAYCVDHLYATGTRE